MEKVSVILNPAAGQQKLAQSLDTIANKLIENFREVSFYKTERPGDGGKYAEQAAEDVDLLIVAGGDGTVHEVANALCKLEKRPVFAIIPGGTSNDFSRAIGMSQNPVKAVDQLLERHIEPIDVGATDKQFFLNFWGIGLITQVSSMVDPETKGTLGRLSYYISTAQNIGDVEPFHLNIHADSYRNECEAAMLIVGNGPFTGGIRAFFPQSDIQDGLLDVLLIKETSLQTLWSMLRSKVASAFPEDQEGIVYLQTDSLTVETEPSLPIDCDGERENRTPSEIRILPGYLEMIVGELPTSPVPTE